VRHVDGGWSIRHENCLEVIKLVIREDDCFIYLYLGVMILI